MHYLYILHNWFERRLYARRIRRLAFDRLREMDKWYNGVYALDDVAGVSITFARGIGGDILKLMILSGNEFKVYDIDNTPLFAQSFTTSTFGWILRRLLRTNPTMELREYDHVTGTVGELISGPPLRATAQAH